MMEIAQRFGLSEKRESTDYTDCKDDGTQSKSQNPDSKIGVGEHWLGPITQIPPGEGRQFRVEGQDVAVFRTRGGEVYATQAYCPHRAGPLIDGLLGGTTLVCPLHAWKFDLATGQAKLGDCGLTTYPVRVTETGEILLRVD